jgi:RNA polymerase III transcription factor (TF)IIIC subunit.
MYFPQVINDSSQRLELKFRPDDPYCRPACSEKVSCRGLVVKMKVIKKRKKSGKETLEIIPQVMGKVSSCYRFRGKSTV